MVITGVTGGGATLGTSTATGTIVDSDGTSASAPALLVTSGTVVEGDAGQRKAQFYIQLSRAATSTVTVTVATADDTATSGTTNDYIAKTTTAVTLTAGQLSKTFDVLVNSDTTDEPDEQFRLNGTPTGATVTPIAGADATMTVANDDATLGRGQHHDHHRAHDDDHGARIDRAHRLGRLGPDTRGRHRLAWTAGAGVPVPARGLTGDGQLPHAQRHGGRRHHG